MSAAKVLDPSENAARGPIKHSAQIDEVPLHRDIRLIHGPYLIRTVDGETAQEVGVDAVSQIPAAGVLSSVGKAVCAGCCSSGSTGTD